MGIKKAPAAELVESIFGYLKTVHDDDVSVRRLVERFESVGICSAEPGREAMHASDLTLTVEELADSSNSDLASVGRTLRETHSLLAWRVDEGVYYHGSQPVSEGYRTGNMHALLAEGDDFAMGLFLLKRNVDYLDHRHAAPEFYLNLTGPTQWRFEFGEWQELPAGSVVWNDPGVVHATRTGDAPWLSFWAWLSETDQQCEVVPEVS